MADFEGLLINAAVYGHNCTYCDCTLVDKASLLVKSGFEERHICSDCIIKKFDLIDDLLERIIKLEGKKEDPERVEIYKKIDEIEKKIFDKITKGKKDAPKPESKPETSKKDDILPEVQDKSEVRPQSEPG